MLSTDLIILIKYIFLGLVQGFTEPIPISSSGHLILFKELFNMEVNGLSFEILVNFASLIAVVTIYRKDIIRLTFQGIKYVQTREAKYKEDFMFIVYLLIATCITGVLGIILKDYVESTLARPIIVGITLLMTGLFLWIIRNLRGSKSDGDLTVKDAIIVGLAQTVALVPGVSRSGATIVAAMLLGMKQETALRFSFLLFIPVSLGAAILSLSDMVQDPNISALAIPYTVAFIASLVATYFSLKWFMNIMAKGNLKYFAYYCFAVGILAVILL